MTKSDFQNKIDSGRYVFSNGLYLREMLQITSSKSYINAIRHPPLMELKFGEPGFELILESHFIIAN